MSSITTFGAFNMARLGIYVSSRALDVTGNNIANINTVGYTRQQAVNASLYLGGSDRYMSRMDHRIGQGAIISSVKQLRDPYLDIRYRNETTKVQEAEQRLNYLDQISGILDEVALGTDGEGVLEAQFNDLISMMDELAGPDGAGKDLNDTLVRESAEALCKRFNQKAKDLAELQAKQEKFFYEDTLPEVNSILKQIQDLTASIRKSQIHGGDALELRDRRNTLIDQLSGYIKIEVTYDEENVGDGLMVERLNIRQPETGAYLIKGVYASSIEKDEMADPDGYPIPLKLTPLTNLKGEVLRNESYESIAGTIQADAHGADGDFIKDKTGLEDFLAANLDSFKDKFAAQGYLNGELRNYKYIVRLEEVSSHDSVNQNSMVSGSDAVEFTGKDLLKVDGLDGVDIEFVTPDPAPEDGKCYDWVIYRYSPPVYPVQIADDALSGSLQSDREMLTEQGEYAMTDDLEYDPKAGIKRGIPYYRKALDTLAAKFAEVMNGANVVPDEDLYYVRKGPDGEPLKGTDGGLVYYDPATGNDVDAANRVMVEGFQDWYKGGTLFSNDSTGDDPSGISAANISVSQKWKLGQVRIVKSMDPLAGSTDNDNIKHMVVLLQQKHDFCSGTDRDNIDPYFTGTFQEMLSNNISETLGMDIRTTELMLQSYTQLQDDLYVKRESVGGVDLNDEAANMMQFQKSYQAACRLMTTVDEMLDKLINGTAV